jgi:hypothetical protein
MWLFLACRPVYATLVWYDYPASGSSVKDLYNDLDLGYQINNRNASFTTFNQTRAGKGRRPHAENTAQGRLSVLTMH